MKEYERDRQDGRVDEKDVSKIKESGLAFTNIPRSKLNFLFTECGNDWNAINFNEDMGTDPLEADDEA